MFGEKSNTLKAEHILSRMAEKYATCRTYYDFGSANAEIISNEGKLIQRRPFTTAFVRPHRFRFEFRDRKGDKWVRYIVWTDGRVVKTWWDIKPSIEKQPSLSLAIAGATGVSGGSAHTVPVLLLPEEMEGKKLTDLVEWKRLEDAEQDQIECWRIQGQNPSPPRDSIYEHFVRRFNLKCEPTTLWIDKATLLLRRIDEHCVCDLFRSEATTIYHPVMDEEIEASKLKFEPRKQADAWE